MLTEPLDGDQTERFTERFAERARQRVAAATFEDALSFLRVGEIAAGAQHVRFKQLFPKADDGSGGLALLIDHLKQQAAVAPDVSARLDRDLVHLVAGINDRSAGVAMELREIAGREFDDYSVAPADDLDAQVRALMVAVARTDPDVRELLHERYASTDAQYARRYEMLLSSLGRTHIEEIHDFDEFSLVLACLLNGFVTRGAIHGDSKRVRELFQAVLVPFLGAITYPTGSLPPTDQSRLLADVTASATNHLTRTPLGSVTVDVDALDDLVGTWRGTLDTDAVAREDSLAADSCEAYLVIDTSSGTLEISQYIETGTSRMITPAFHETGDGRRLSCLYEADRAGNPRPDFPSHRGAWVLDAPTPARALHASYFNDRGRNGRFDFIDHAGSLATGFRAARSLFADNWVRPPLGPSID